MDPAKEKVHTKVLWRNEMLGIVTSQPVRPQFPLSCSPSANSNNLVDGDNDDSDDNGNGAEDLTRP